MRLSDLQSKKIINIKDGKEIGSIIDINVNLDGTINSLVIEKYKFILSYFNNKEITITWKQIEKIGEDVILVNIVY